MVLQAGSNALYLLSSRCRSALVQGFQDLADAIERLIPRQIPYAHDQRWGDGNGHSHVRAALLGPSLHIPVVDGRLSLGTWQQVVLINFDNRARRRRLIIQIMGERE